MEPTEAGIRSVVDLLCSSTCAGRRPGSSAGAAARDFVAGAFEDIGLAPFGEHGYLQPIPAIDGDNVLGRIAGHGPRAGRCVILAAHYDVWTAPGDPSAYLGADDNAAAVGILLHCAASLAARRHDLDRSVLFCSFDAEEPEYFLTPDMGSQYFVDHPTLPLDTMDMMVCLDLVGHAVGREGLPGDLRESVFVLGAEHSQGTGALVDGVASVPGITPRRIDNYLIPPLSDYYAFGRNGVPFLFYTCGRWEHYHRPTDTPDRLDYPKMAALARHLTALMVELSLRPEEGVLLVPGGIDDRATLDSLVAVAKALAPADGRMVPILDRLRALREIVADGGVLGRDERLFLASLVPQLEGALG